MERILKERLSLVLVVRHAACEAAMDLCSDTNVMLNYYLTRLKIQKKEGKLILQEQEVHRGWEKESDFYYWAMYLIKAI